MLRRYRESEFPAPSANGIHGLPAVRLAPTLDLIELMSRLAPGSLWECAQIVECAATELERLRIDHQD
jgi:hypothetical protein